MHSVAMKYQDRSTTNYALWIPITIVLLLSTTEAFTQVETWIQDSIFSNTLNETRRFQVILPKDYTSDSLNASYEVLYVLDGQYYAKQVPFICDWTIQSGYMPQTIIVILPNSFKDGVNQRMRDFTPTNSPEEEYFGTDSGGADDFLSFLKDELLPFIDGKYPTNGSSSLIGSSLSGLFVVYTFLQYPDLFRSYIASDPSLFWDNGFIGKLAIDRLPAIAHAKSTFWIAGLEHTYEYMGIKKLDSLLKSINIGYPKWKCKIYTDETHFSVQHKAFYDGLRFSHFGYNNRMPTYHPMKGTVETNGSIEVRVFDTPVGQNIRYTADGSDPSETSKRIEQNQVIAIVGPSTFKVKKFANRTEYVESEEGNFSFESSVVPDSSASLVQEPKLKYSYFKGNWDVLPNSNTMSPTSSKLLKRGFKFADIIGSEESGLHLIEGKFDIFKNAYYVFVLSSENDARLTVGGFPTINIEKGYKREQSFVLPLKRGSYTIRLEYLAEGDLTEIHFGCFISSSNNKSWWEHELSIF